ncbi:DUF5324 family protein [Streptomyces glaucosporus]|uniref:DUF5324 family protein n=1 Tax=Streptomyces glaucosporus TaxID=284044 RepID=A0ABP5URZ4_9ACTN
MTRMDSVRSATDNARETVRHAAEVVAPKVSLAAGQARSAVRGQYASHVAPRLVHVRETLPPAIDMAAVRAAQRTREAARMASEFAAPRVEAARAMAGPAREAAMARSAAAVAALRGELTADDIRRLAQRRARRARTGMLLKRLTVAGLVAGGAAAAWKWWDKQAGPDWLVEPPAATEIGGEGGATLADGDGSAAGGASSRDGSGNDAPEDASGDRGSEAASSDEQR